MDPEQLAGYLLQHPDFFERHPEVLAGLTIAHPQNGQAISLLERQVQLLRERLKAVEARLEELLRHGRDNDQLVQRIIDWARALLAVDDPRTLAPVAVAELKALFDVPYGALRIFRPRPQFADLECAQAVTDDAMRLAASMLVPYCGTNVAFEPARWLSADMRAVRSLAMIPLRSAAAEEPLGLLVLGSPDSERFVISMATDFLIRIGDLASTALLRLSL